MHVQKRFQLEKQNCLKLGLILGAPMSKFEGTKVDSNPNIQDQDKDQGARSKPRVLPL